MGGIYIENMLFRPFFKIKISQKKNSCLFWLNYIFFLHDIMIQINLDPWIIQIVFWHTNILNVSEKLPVNPIHLT